MASRIELWPVGRLVPYERNTRTHSPEQIDQIAASIIEFGFTQPILVDQVDGILAGHARLKAAIKLGMTEVPVIQLDHLTEKQRRAYIIADNKLAENAGWDDELLRQELAALQADDFDLEVTGFSTDELEAILDDSEEAIQGETDPDEAPALEEEPVSRTGDLWLLGNHRILVGDARSREDVANLMHDDRAQLVLTDPPYNCDYHNSQRSRRRARINGNREKLHDTIEQDDAPPEVFEAFCDGFLPLYREWLRRDGSMYLFMALHRQAIIDRSLAKAGFATRCHIIWAKNHFVLTFNRYKQQHESLVYCHIEGETDQWYGDNSQATIWLCKKPMANREHPTMKPIELLEKAIINSTRRGDVVMDFFGGSGSTLIACERMGRKGRLIEISPVYVDVTLRRWAAYTKQQPVLAASGSSFMQIERERLLLEKKPAPRSSAAGEQVTKGNTKRVLPVGV